jgi:hypothetical protein
LIVTVSVAVALGATSSNMPVLIAGVAGPHPRPVCRHLLTRRAFHFAIDHADRLGDPQIEPPYLVYGAVRDALDPTSTQLSRRAVAALAAGIPAQ